jgi:hypothetical protein
MIFLAIKLSPLSWPQVRPESRAFTVAVPLALLVFSLFNARCFQSRKPGKSALLARSLRYYRFPGFPRFWTLFLWSSLCSLAGLREKNQQRKDSMQSPVCPKCSSGYVKRVSRIGPERLISLFYIYPFRCQPCGHRFRLFQWGVTYTRTELDRRAGRKRRRTRVR